MISFKRWGRSRIRAENRDEHRESASYGGKPGVQDLVVVLASGLSMEDEERIARELAAIEGVTIVLTMNEWQDDKDREKAQHERFLEVVRRGEEAKRRAAEPSA